jgi:hypothetical protein
VSKTEQLDWEARLSRPAAIAAFAAGLLVLAGQVVLQSVLENRRRIEPLPDFLLSTNDSPGSVIAAGVMQAVAALLMTLVFYYLFRATVHRSPTIPRWFVYFVVVGPAMYAISQVLGALERVDVAETFVDQTYSFPDANPDDDPDLTGCPAIRGQLGEDCGQELLRENASPVGLGLGLAGSVAVAFLFVMLPLRARRAGLLSPFMSILGVITGALLVLQLLPVVPVIIQAFWLGAIGALFLGNWPGGRGPAWETGEPDPWPSPAQRRGLEPSGGPEPEPEPQREADAGSDGPEPEPAPRRPSSRKRKRR